MRAAGTVNLKNLDKALPASFSPTTPAGFDCATADWSTKIKPGTDTATIARHTACDAGMKAAAGELGPGCFSDTDYAQSTNAVTIEFEEEAVGDLEPEIIVE